jgi:hypothetical protein
MSRCQEALRPADLNDGKSVVLRPMEAYDARDKAQSEISALGETDGKCVVCSVVRKEIDGFTIGN